MFWEGAVVRPRKLLAWFSRLWRLGFEWVPSLLFLLLWLNLQFDVINLFFVDRLDASVFDWSLLDGLSFGSPNAVCGFESDSVQAFWY